MMPRLPFLGPDAALHRKDAHPANQVHTPLRVIFTPQSRQQAWARILRSETAPGRDGTATVS